MSEKTTNPCPDCGKELGTGQAPANCTNPAHLISATNTGPAADFAAKLQKTSAALDKSMTGQK
jgi:hypothetical protein